MIALSPDVESVERVIESGISWVRLALDTAGVLVIVAGGAQAIAALPAAIRGDRRFTQVRLDFARYLLLTLEFQLAADVIETALTPTWPRLGQLAVIATIRTALNFFLGREMKEERASVAESPPGDGKTVDLARSSR
jgi:uncharacterized membrane protein